MIPAPLPHDEEQRLSTLAAYELSGVDRIEALDELATLAADLLGAPMGLLSIIGEDDQCFLGRCGLEATGTPRSIAFCAHAILAAEEVLVVPDARADPRFAGNPLVREGCGNGKKIGFYAGVPLRARDGQPLGTLCVADERPRRPSEREIGILRALGRQGEHLLELHRERVEAAARVARLDELSLIVSRTDSAAIITGADRRISYVNPAFTRISGYTAAEAIGRNPGELLQGPETDPQTVAFMRARLAAGEGFTTEVRNHHRDGHAYWLELEVRPVHDEAGGITHFIAIERDITEQRATREALTQSEARFERIVSNVPGMVFRSEMPVDQKTRFTYASRGCETLYGISPEEILGDAELLFGRVHPDDVETLHAGIASALASDGHLEWTGRHLPDVVPGADRCPLDAGRRARWLHVRSRCEADGRGGCTSEGIVLDVTESRLHEDRLRAATAAAEEATLAAEGASRAKSQFLAHMSHEIRTPLNGVLGMTELLLRRGLSEQQAGYAGVIRSSAQSLLSLINDILDFSKVEAGKLELSPSDVSTRDLVAEVMQMLARSAGPKGLELACRVDPEVPHRVRLDGERLRQVLVNLTNNAIKFTAAGEVVVGISLEADPGAEPRLRVEVRDSGIGIPAERIDRLFRSFSQVDASTTRRYGGTGLGLAISRELVHLMGGDIGVESEPGRGSTFWFTVAAGQPEDAAPATASWESVPSPSTTTRRRCGRSPSSSRPGVSRSRRSTTGPRRWRRCGRPRGAERPSTSRSSTS
ncbi:putative two-component system sensor histidine kinase [Phycisphaera mikurensis NBRC 102666]|uniref:Sensory/regulatory protein RpfC n=1 Tax=Phycisphaera mikurensis (strain NBRC 102666 / KCTC 22515 / FYK2301M01) TaxID=1142394 RepID=I0IH60_PHYMF|nr:PAS domain S-box-containing protein [Phycisphaera mikurensis]BAM04598.1 putative two-component system sensor histidine kinase [Phycisphaera mikurensis NBRC 102666]